MRSRVPVMLRLAIVVAGAAMLAGCDISFEAGNQVVVRDEKHFTVSGTPDLTLGTFDGSVEIRAWDRPEISVAIEKRAQNKAEADAIEVKAQQAGNRVSVEAVHQGSHRLRIGFVVSPTAKLVASVPRQCNLVVKSGDGSITVERVAGTIELQTSDGSIRADDVSGRLRAHTSDGSVKLDRMNGAIDLDTSDGGVTASGKLDVVRIRTSDGSVSLRLADGSAMAEDWEIRTGDGGVTMEVPDAFNANVDLSTGDGTVSIRDVKMEATGETSRRAAQGRIGSGGRQLRIRTGDGSIVIRKG